VFDVGDDASWERLLEWHRRLYEAGYIALRWPQEWGGAGARRTGDLPGRGAALETATLDRLEAALLIESQSMNPCHTAALALVGRYLMMAPDRLFYGRPERAAEAAGAHSIWVAEGWGHDAFTSLTMLAVMQQASALSVADA
jgi:hypothetical protein